MVIARDLNHGHESKTLFTICTSLNSFESCEAKGWLYNQADVSDDGRRSLNGAKMVAASGIYFASTAGLASLGYSS